MARLSRTLPRTTLYDPPSEIRTIFLARVCSFRYHYCRMLWQLGSAPRLAGSRCPFLFPNCAVVRAEWMVKHLASHYESLARPLGGQGPLFHSSFRGTSTRLGLPVT